MLLRNLPVHIGKKTIKLQSVLSQLRSRCISFTIVSKQIPTTPGGQNNGVINVSSNNQNVGKFTFHPIFRGMLTYSVLWPVSNICQQLIKQQSESEGNQKDVDLKQTLRYSLFGSCYVAPSLYLWVKFISYLIPGQGFVVAVKRVVVEQFLYAPFGISSFFIGLCLLEGKSWNQAVEECKVKFLPTYKTGICVWPLVQTLNHTFVKEKNRVPVTGVVSFFWTVFLSYMKQLEINTVVPSSTDLSSVPTIPTPNIMIVK